MDKHGTVAANFDTGIEQFKACVSQGSQQLREVERQVDKLEADYYQGKDYQAYADMGKDQQACLMEADFCDEIHSHTRIYNVCRAKSRWDKKRKRQAYCGTAYMSRM